MKSLVFFCFWKDFGGQRGTALGYAGLHGDGPKAAGGRRKALDVKENFGDSCLSSFTPLPPRWRAHFDLPRDRPSGPRPSAGPESAEIEPSQGHIGQRKKKNK